ncbi:DUF4199 domain-containing protein [Aestuariibacter halophilus]|uniref:DUF4199 domain-containing protein n=1 Tax=Fluctibacter halophilus TaxID=226011 RepID=A0ABS8G3H8_9ALTE|nr:DUF4199 domain-containing protein [Aestuariibacter halophilus]MCC2614661.1 DUF4199 domain-containing protein [Aestuariibacter halophilus]
MLRLIATFGTLYGLALLLGFFVSHLIFGTSPDNFSQAEITGYGVMLVSGLAIVMGMLAWRSQQPQGMLGWASALSIGVGISFIGGLFFGAYNWAYLVWINPEFTDTYIAWQIDTIEQSAVLSMTEKQQRLEELDAYAGMMQSKPLQSLVMAATVWFIGTIITLIAALVLCQRKSH